jgi:hypothetical protein
MASAAHPARLRQHCGDRPAQPPHRSASISAPRFEPRPESENGDAWNRHGNQKRLPLRDDRRRRAGRAWDDVPMRKTRSPSRCERRHRLVGVGCADDDDHPDPAVEHAMHLGSATLPARCSQSKIAGAAIARVRDARRNRRETSGACSREGRRR